MQHQNMRSYYAKYVESKDLGRIKWPVVTFQTPCGDAVRLMLCGKEIEI